MDIQSTIARNLKTIRSLKGFTLEEAAQLSGVSRSMLSQIERGEVNPTVSTVWKIANGYKISFSSLFQEDAHAVTIVRKTETNPLIADDGRYQNFPIFPFREDRLFETYQLDLLEGGHMDAQPQMTETEEYLTVFAGRVEITTGGETFTLEEGDSAHFFADTDHSYRNVGTGTAKLSMMLYYNLR